MPETRRYLTFGFVLSGLVVLGLALPLAAHQPPANLKLVNGHWTAWDPPSMVPEGSEVYTIQRGDTLWDIAERYYGDPYYWPQLWERNPYILDAYWIYPGDPLVVTLDVVPFGELADATAASPDDFMTDERSPFADGRNRPETLGIESDLYCHGYIGDPDELFPYKITGSEYENMNPTLGGNTIMEEGEFGVLGSVKVDLSSGDIVYLDGGDSGGLSPGDLYTIVRPEEIVTHPVSKEETGRFHRYLGTVRVLSVQEETAIAEIATSCHPVTVGSYLKRFEPQPVPLGRRSGLRPVNAPASDAELQDAATIVFHDAGLLSLGQDHVVFIDRGATAEVSAGELYTIYRTNPHGRPAMVLGELAVLAVNETSALARILESRSTIFVGDRVIVD